MRVFPPRHRRAMRLVWSCCGQSRLTPQIADSDIRAPVVSRWQPVESGRLGTQGSNGKQHYCKAHSGNWSAYSPLLRHQGSSFAHLTAHPKSSAEFSHEHLSSDDGGTAFSSKMQEREYEAAKRSAAGSLSLRPHSRQELEVKLKEKGYSAGAIGRALDRLKELELQSDADFAEVYTRSKWRQSRWAPSRIQQVGCGKKFSVMTRPNQMFLHALQHNIQLCSCSARVAQSFRSFQVLCIGCKRAIELIRKGVSRQDCQNALEGVFGESSRGRIRVDLGDLQKEDVDMCTLFGNEGRVDQQLLASAQRRAAMSEGLPAEARKRRLTGWLLRRGHDWDTVSKLVALLKL